MANRSDNAAGPAVLDKLYQLPLSEFTSARNALAKAAGARGGTIRAQEKPSLPAWAVNQLYWRERKRYDKLVRAAERLRAGHAHALAGKKADLAMLELQHAAAVKEAADAVRAVLARGGDPATPATMKAVVDTLQALPGGGRPGCLTKALAPLGFGALGVLMKGARTSRALADVVTFAPPKPRADEQARAAEEARVAQAKRLRELEARRTALNRQADVARTAFERAERARTMADQQLQKAAAESARRRTELDKIERELRTVAGELEVLKC